MPLEVTFISYSLLKKKSNSIFSSTLILVTLCFFRLKKNVEFELIIIHSVIISQEVFFFSVFRIMARVLSICAVLHVKLKASG